MNKHIELVKKWLDDPSSVTAEELKANATEVAYLGYVADAAAFADTADDVEHYVKKYEELTGER
tara:strand:+ start:653 stop:844 length:192 start_codon:yes stop_codon:yes gene_type:complete